GAVEDRVGRVGRDRHVEDLDIARRGVQDVGHLHHAQPGVGGAAVAGLFHEVHGVAGQGAVHVHGGEVFVDDVRAVPAGQVDGVGDERGAGAEDGALADGQHLDVVEQALAADREREHVEGEHVGAAGAAEAVEVAPEPAAGVGRTGGGVLGNADLTGQEV